MRSVRGWLSLFTKEGAPSAYGTGIFLASSEMDVITKVRPRIAKKWPCVRFTIVAPQAYEDEFRSESEVLWLEQLKSTPLRSLRTMRNRKFDLCVAVAAGRPTFRKLKMSSLFLNAKRVFIYNENGDSIAVDRAHWKPLFHHLLGRARGQRSFTLFWPFGLSYLLVRTGWLRLRAKFRTQKT